MHLALINALISYLIPGRPRGNLFYLAVVLGIVKTELVLVAGPLCAAVVPRAISSSCAEAHVRLRTRHSFELCLFSIRRGHSLDLSGFLSISRLALPARGRIAQPAH